MSSAQRFYRMEAAHKFFALMLVGFIVVQVQAFGVEKDVSPQRRLLQTGTVDCPSKCDGRCALAGRADRCIQYCMICCGRCNCVPSGTYGYTPGDCNCYANMKNSKGGHKCP